MTLKTLTKPPFQAGDDFDDAVVQSAMWLTEGIWFFCVEDAAFIRMREDVVAKIPEPWQSSCPLVEQWRSPPTGWVDWALPKPRGRRKAA